MELTHKIIYQQLSNLTQGSFWYLNGNIRIIRMLNQMHSTIATHAVEYKTIKTYQNERFK